MANPLWRPARVRTVVLAVVLMSCSGGSGSSPATSSDGDLSTTSQPETTQTTSDTSTTSSDGDVSTTLQPETTQTTSDTSTSSTAPGDDVTSTTNSETTTTTAEDGRLAVSIIAPLPLSIHSATEDLTGGVFGAEVIFRAEVSAPTGQTADVRWESDVDGFLGTGVELLATLTNGSLDTVEHIVTVTVSSGGALANAAVRVIVKVPSN